MKFVKSNLAKKIIIILIAIMIFNIAVPQKVNADVLSTILDIGGGILFKPLSTLILGILFSINVTLSLSLTGLTFALDAVDTIVNLVKGEGEAALGSADSMLSKIFIGPDTIFMGEVPMLNANIFNTYTDTSDWQNVATWIAGLIGAAAPGTSMVQGARNAVSMIYVTLRNICALIMLAGLIFTGIRILLSANIPTKKTQYLMLLQDWLLGMVILIFSHIIMIGIFYLSDTLTASLKGSLSGFGGINFNLSVNILSSVSFMQQVVMLIMLGYTIWLTIIFAISYFKRFMWVCVLTVFAPVFSVMYAFGQQSKQIYSRWFREYMMTVLVQPFHMVVYSVLVGIPLKVVGNGSFDVNRDVFTMTYALMSISFIRPAEKFMRGLFGMDKGVANMASYDSGKQTFDAVKNAIEDVFKKVASVAMMVATGGATAGLGAAAGAAGAASGATGALGQAGQVAGALGESGAAGALGEAGNALGEAGNMLGQLENGDKTPNWISEGWDTDSQGRFLNPYNDEWYTEEELNAGRDLPGYMDQDDFSEADIRALSEGIKESQGDGAGMISAANVTIQASNLDIQGLNSSTNGNAAQEIAKAEIESAEIEDGGQKEETELKEEDFSLGDGEELGKKKGLFSNLGAFSGLMSGSGSLSDITENLGGPQWLRKLSSKAGSLTGKGLESMSDSKIGFVRKIGKGGTNIRDFVANGGIKALEDSGAITSAVKGFHGIMDTMYVDGGAPQDWKQNVQRMEESKKKKDEKAIYNFTNNKENKEYVSMKLMEEAKDKYSDPDRRQQYVDNNLESRLKSLAQTYAPMGLSSAKMAYEIKDEGKKLGLSPEEAVLNRGAFERFSSDRANTAAVNAKYEINAPTVSQAMPAAREYYNNGYRDIQHMMDAQHIKDTLKTTTDMAMKLENVLRNTGKVNYNGADKAVQAKIDEINKYYEKKLKGGK